MVNRCRSASQVATSETTDHARRPGYGGPIRVRSKPRQARPHRHPRAPSAVRTCPRPPITERCGRPVGSGAAEIVLDADDAVLVEIGAGPDLDDLDRDLARVAETAAPTRGLPAPAVQRVSIGPSCGERRRRSRPLLGLANATPLRIRQPEGAPVSGFRARIDVSRRGDRRRAPGRGRGRAACGTNLP